MAGYCRILREEQNPQVKEHMIDYLIALMEDAHDFSWDAARASYAVLLCRMEQGEVKNYTETEKLDRIRRANAQRHVFSSTNEGQNSLLSNLHQKYQNLGRIVQSLEKVVGYSQMFLILAMAGFKLNGSKLTNR